MKNRIERLKLPSAISNTSPIDDPVTVPPFRDIYRRKLEYDLNIKATVVLDPKKFDPRFLDPGVQEY